MLLLPELMNNLIQIMVLYSEGNTVDKYSTHSLHDIKSIESITDQSLHAIKTNPHSNKYPFADYLKFIIKTIADETSSLTKSPRKEPLTTVLCTFFIDIRDLLYIKASKKVSYNGLTEKCPSLQRMQNITTSYTRMGHFVKELLADPLYMKKGTLNHEILKTVEEIRDNFKIVITFPELKATIKEEKKRISVYCKALQEATANNIALSEEVSALTRENEQLKEYIMKYCGTEGTDEETMEEDTAQSFNRTCTT